MKTREQIYKGEGAALLRILTTYHALHYEQVLQLFDKNRDSIKSLITSLTKQGRIYHDKEQHLLCDTEESAHSPDMGTIAAFWVRWILKRHSSTIPAVIFPLNYTSFPMMKPMKSFMLQMGRKR
mgnify:CR=1 FL=1